MKPWAAIKWVVASRQLKSKCMSQIPIDSDMQRFFPPILFFSRVRLDLLHYFLETNSKLSTVG